MCTYTCRPGQVGQVGDGAGVGGRLGMRGGHSQSPLVQSILRFELETVVENAR